MIQFNRSEVAEQYECLVDVDFIIHISCYSGPISNLSPCGARALVRSQSPYIKEKPPVEEEEN